MNVPRHLSASDRASLSRRGDFAAFVAAVVLLVVGFLVSGWAGPTSPRWAAWLVCAALGIWAALGLVRGRWERRELFPAKVFLLGISALLGWTLLQQLPLPAALTALLSPAWGSAREAAAASGVDLSSWLPLAQAPDAAWRSWNQLVAFMLFFAAMVLQAKSRSGAWRLLVLAVTVCAVESLVGLLGYALGVTERARGAAYNPNHHAAFVLMGLPLLAWCCANAAGSGDAHGAAMRRSDRVVFLGVLTGISAVGWLASLSRGSLMLGGAVLGSWIVMEWWIYRARTSKRRRHQSPVLAYFLVASSVLLLLLASTIVPTMLESLSVSGTHAIGRAELWRATLLGLVESRGLGIGLGGTEFAINRFLDVPRFAQPIWSHNDHIQFVAEVGHPGVVIAGHFLIRFVRALAARWRENEVSLVSSSFAPYRAAIAGMATVLAHSASDFPLRVPQISFVFAILLALVCTDGLRSRVRSADRDDGRGDQG